MGCTPSIHVNQTGVIYCHDSDESPPYTAATASNHQFGIQGQFRTNTNTDDTTIANGQNGVENSQNSLPPCQEESVAGVILCDIDGMNKKTCSSMRFGPMCLTQPTIKVLLVFAKDDAQSDALKWCAEKLHYDCTLVYKPDKAIEEYLNKFHHLVIIDARHYKAGFDPVALCRSFRCIQGNQYTCMIAVVKKSIADKEDASVLPLLKAGFNRWLLETYNLGICLNELIQTEFNDISHQIKLKAAQALFTALDNCRDGVIITNGNHDIQFVNRASEKLLGISSEDMSGKTTHDLYKVDSLKADILDSINMQVKKGKEWEGTTFHKRASGETIPLWSKIFPVGYHNGLADYLVHVKESPYTEKFTPESDGVPYPCNSVKGARKASCDVRSLCSEAGLHRRQSFARFHAMTIEAPITKVINMLLATQENSPVFVSQALDRVLDILRSSELYSPQFTALNHSRPDDQMTSDLVSGLITGHKAGFRRLSHEASLKGVSPSPPPPNTATPSLSSAPTNTKKLLESADEWSFDIIELEKITEKRPLIWLGMTIFAKYNACRTLQCEEIILKNWLTLIEANYHSNPYHNSTHAADVLQATACFLQKPKIKVFFDGMDELICLIAAIVHDVDHPGKTNAFLCNSGNHLAILYNDLCVLESHHAAFAFKLTTSGVHVNILQHLEAEMYIAVRHSIIDMVLATEMTKHFEHISKFVNVFGKTVISEDEAYEPEVSIESSELITPENVMLVKRMLIKCADVSNPARPIKMCKEWAYRIAEEYCAQTEEEKSSGLPVVMPTFDRAKCSIPKCQLGFIDYFVNDMFDAWDAFGDFPELTENIKKNYQYWKEQELREQQEGKVQQVKS